MPTKKIDIHATITESTVPDNIRKRIQFPTSDQVVADWMKAQDNLSLSVRLMIHDEVRLHGIQDRVNRIGAMNVPATTAASSASSLPDAETIARFLEQDGVREIFAPLLASLIAEAS